MDFVSSIMKQFTYEYLPAGNWIRLLQLLPGQFEDPLAVNLVAVNLEEPTYEAISYAWEIRRINVKSFVQEEQRPLRSASSKHCDAFDMNPHNAPSGLTQSAYILVDPESNTSET